MFLFFSTNFLFSIFFEKPYYFLFQITYNAIIKINWGGFMENFKNVKKVFSASDEMEAEIIVSLLEVNQILSYKKGHGNSDLMNVYSGNSIQGIDIMVAEEQEKEALLLLKDYKDQSQHNTKISQNKTKRISQIILVILLVLFVFVSIWGALFS